MDQGTQTQTSASANPAAGWYPDPQGQGLRWWDGSAWTEHTHNEGQAAGAASASPVAVSTAPAASSTSAVSKSSATTPAKADGKKRVSFVNDNAVPILIVLAVVLAVVLALQVL